MEGVYTGHASNAACVRFRISWIENDQKVAFGREVKVDCGFVHLKARFTMTWELQ